MALRPIHLIATESNWRLFMMRKADQAFLSFQSKVFVRDEHTCQFCGFQAKQYLEVINGDGNCLNNALSNLITACPFCAQCFFLEAIGKSDFGGGTLICLPEMTQGELNALCHVLFVSIVSGNSYSVQAKNVYRSLKLRSQHVEQELGQGFSNPALLGHMLIDAKVDNIDGLHTELAPKLRVLPNITRFSTEIEAWALAGLQMLGEG